VTGAGFTPNTQVTTTINGDNSTATSTETDSAGGFTSTLGFTASPGTVLTLKSTESSTGVSATTTYAVP
jgi:hypothetical protein